jgi:hypothetical protein
VKTKKDTQIDLEDSRFLSFSRFGEVNEELNNDFVFGGFDG